MRSYHKGRTMGCPGYQIEYCRIDNSYYHNGASHPIRGLPVLPKHFYRRSSRAAVRGY
jgi:hypothetical protein